MARRILPIVWSARAVRDLHQIADYIRQHRPEAARRVREDIRGATRRLGRFPLSGRSLPEWPDAPFRELIVGNYRVIYEPRPEQVEIVAVIHGSRDLGGQSE